MGRLLHLLLLSFQFGQSLVICYFLHQAPNLGSEVQLYLIQGSVCVFYCVVEQGRLGIGSRSVRGH